MKEKPIKRDIIVTGIPRSGTTLACTLINSLSNSVCLSEPAIVDKFINIAQSPDEYIRLLEDEYDRLRGHIWQTRQIFNKHGLEGGKITNYFSRDTQGQTAVNFKVEKEKVEISDEYFILGMKHNAHFMSILPQLARNSRFSIFAIIRDPIATILSWRSLSLPVSEGRLPAARKFWSVIRAIEDSGESILVKQVRIYEQFCLRLLEMEKFICLIQYEDIINNPEYFGRFFGQTPLYQTPIKFRNIDSYPNKDEAQIILQNIERYAPSALHIYRTLAGSHL